MNLKPYPKYKDSGIEWLGEIPEGWEVKRLKYATENLDNIRVPLSAEERGQVEGSYPYYGATGIIDYVNDCLFDGEYLLIGEDGAPFFLENEDVAFIAKGKFWVNNHAHILKTHENSDIRFVMHSLNCVDYEKYITGSTRDKLTQSDLSRIIIPFPSLSEQTAIANYLDQKTSKIDELIKKNEKLIELLKEKRQAVISHAVTKGRDPNVKMRDSGIDWIGQIPERWEVKKIKYTSYIKGRVGWHGLRSDEFTDEGPYLVTGTDFIGDKVNWETCYHISDERYNQDPYIQLRDNDLLITKDGTIGKVALAKNLPDKATLNSGIMLIRPVTEDYCTDFMFWILNSKVFSEYNEHTKTGSTIQHLYQETFENFIFSAPHIDEQKNICTYLIQKTAHVDESIQKIQSQNETLKEYRQALISNVVTGKVRITGEL